MKHGAAAGIVVALVGALAASAAAQPMVQLDPFAQATSGLADCPAQSPPLLTEQEARAESHVRVERGTRCAMEGTCEPGGAYRRDPEINDRVRALIAADPRFADTSVWLTTSRRWVTLRGCVRDNAQRRALNAAVAKAPNVERVFDELTIVRRPKSRR
jgi:osmotically-inducible protein OsmY